MGENPERERIAVVTDHDFKCECALCSIENLDRPCKKDWQGDQADYNAMVLGFR